MTVVPVKIPNPLLKLSKLVPAEKTHNAPYSLSLLSIHALRPVATVIQSGPVR